MHTLLAGNDFLDDLAILPTINVPLTDDEALLVRFISVGFSNDPSDPLR